MLKYKWLLTRARAEGGFNLIESLVAVIVLGILFTALLPLISIAVATRVNARRVDLATQAARSYMEAVRAGVISVADLPSAQIAPPDVVVFDGIAPPNPSTYLSATLTPALQGTRFDGNNDGKFDGSLDFIIQPMRTHIVTNPPNASEPATTRDRETALRNQGFILGVRVYRADGFTGALYRGLPTETQCRGSRVVFRGSSNIGNRACPVVIMRAEIMSKTGNTPEILRRIGSRRS